jgi:muramoyltetrapeptide carboxypeptidase
VNPEKLARGVAEIEALGFRTRVPTGLLDRNLFMAGDVQRRLAQLHALFEDDEVAGIVCARGGAGTGGVLGGLDMDLVLSHPKVFVGYSDITFLHQRLNNGGLVTLHGPMAAAEFASGTYDRQSFLGAVGGTDVPYSSGPDDLLPIRQGVAEGRLRGGCLSILAAGAGTPWALSHRGEDILLFLEDVDEAPYRIDRLLVQLRESGLLARVSGIVLGDMKGCSPGLSEPYALEDVILSALEGLDVPIALGLSSGHASGASLTIPLGVRARLDCGEEARLEVLEPGVA